MTALVPEVFRFGLVGVASNLILFAIYLALTGLELGHKLSMSLVFAAGVFQTFYLNKKWTFRSEVLARKEIYRYMLVYAIAWFLNLLCLSLFVDYFGFPHQFVQGVMVLSLSITLFCLQKFWVFRPVNRYSEVRLRPGERDPLP